MTTAGPIPGAATQQFASVAICMLPVLALSSSTGLSLVQLLVLLGGLCLAPRQLAAWYREQARPLRWVLFGFAGYFTVSLLRMAWFHQPARMLDGPLRLLLALACIGFVAHFRPRIAWFWVALGLAALGAAAIALVQCLALGLERADGFTHHSITFGDLAMALGMMSLCAVAPLRATRMAWLPLAGVAGGLLAALLSGSRGAWMVLPLVAVPLLHYGRSIHGRRLMYGMALVALLALLAYCVPASGVAARTALAFSDVRGYFDHADATTSVGIRLELWKAAWMMFRDHPVLGVGRDDFHGALQLLAQQGRLLQSPALAFSSPHNDLLNMLSTGGLLDTVFLLFMYGGPLGFFVAVLRLPDQGQRSPALAGIVLVVCFIGFGLTDVMFWLMATKVFYGMMVCTLIGFCCAVPALPPQQKAARL